MKSPFDRENQQEQTDSKLVVAMEKLAESFRVLLWEQTKAHKLSPIQIQILIFLKNHGSELSKPAELATALNVTRPTISDAIKALNNKGMLDMRPNPADSRSRLLYLSKKAEALTDSLEQYATPLQSAISSLSEEEQSVMLQSLIQMLHQLENQGVISPQRMCFNCAYYRGNRESEHYCNFLEKSLANRTLRVDCPEHKAA